MTTELTGGVTGDDAISTAAPRRLRRRALRWANFAAAITLGIGVLLVATPANAASVVAGVNIRPCVNTASAVCAPVGTTAGTGINTIRCWRDGSWATGNYSSPRWFLVYLSDGREGYVHSSYVSGQYTTPNCSTLAYVRAADQALSYVGQTHATTFIASKYSDWVPGPPGEWSGDCAKLTSSAYIYGAGVSYASGDAINQYRAYKNAGQILGGIPRYGAPVFYNIAAPYGHTAIYVGGTTVVTTVGMDYEGKPVARKDLYSFANYLGWAKIG